MNNDNDTLAPDDEPPKGGRPQLIFPDEVREMVKYMIIAGYTQEMISNILDITPKTFRKHFKTEINMSVCETEVNLTRMIVKKAEQGDVGAARLWLTTHASERWTAPDKRETSTNEPKFNELSEDEKDLLGRLVDYKIIKDDDVNSDDNKDDNNVDIDGSDKSTDNTSDSNE